MSNEIVFRVRDLHIKTLDNGKEIVGLRANTAFDEDLINECKEKGVKPAYEREEE